MNPTDAELMKRVLDRDALAFDALYGRHVSRIRSRLRRILREESAVEDLVQEVFLRLWTKGDQWQGRGSLEGWLNRVATNLALNHLRSIHRRRELPLDVPKEAMDADDDDEMRAPTWLIDSASLDADAMVTIREERETIGRLLDRLPEEQREVIRLVVDAEMDIKSAADSLGIPKGTVKSRLYYAKRRLGREWRDAEPELK